MLYLWTILLTILMPYSFLQAEHLDEDHSQQVKLQKCLMECWGVDSHTTLFLCKYFNPFLENKNFHNLIDDFLKKSIKLNIQFPIESGEATFITPAAEAKIGGKLF